MKHLGEDISAGKRMPRPHEQECFCSKAPGYLCAWHAQPPLSEYGYKYSGGLGTYCSSHLPLAIHAPAVEKTFFCWGGMAPGQTMRPRNWDFCTGQQLHMVGYYDHKTGLVPRPTILFDKYCADTHDNPVMTIDGDGHIWIFSPSHGEWTTPSFIHRSVEPYAIDRFETIQEGLFAYPQSWWHHKHGFTFIHTRYQAGRMLHVQRSLDGRNWSHPLPLAGIQQGHYHVSSIHDDAIGLAFNMHPTVGGLDARTNLYYMVSHDGGQCWKTVDGKALQLPLREAANPALIWDAQSQGLLVFLMDLTFDAAGNPAVLYLTSHANIPGPASGPRTWMIASFRNGAWHHEKVTTSDNNYDCGALYIEGDVWRIIGPTEVGPQPWTTGGEMARFISMDAGRSWNQQAILTQASICNHTYARRVMAGHPDFAALWADGDTKTFSQSFLYFCGLDDSQVWRLPPVMPQDHARPEPL